MTAGMATRIRIIIDTTEERRRAVQIRAAVIGGSPSDVLNELIDDNLATEIKQARRAIKEGGGDPEATVIEGDAD